VHVALAGYTVLSFAMPHLAERLYLSEFKLVKYLVPRQILN